MTKTNYNPWTITKPEISGSEAINIAENRTNWDYKQIESIPEAVAALMAEDHEVIKGHDVYFINFDGHFKYSCVVFYNGHLIRYAGDYELHHNGKTHEELYNYYIKSLNEKLYTDDELSAPLKNYNDYTRRCYYMSNYYGDREDNISYYHTFHNEDEEEARKAVIENLYFSDVCLAYYANADFVEKVSELQNKIEEAKKATENDFEYWKNAFYYEFFNFECIIGGRYAEAAYTATNGEKLNDVQKKAYTKAKREYENYCLSHDMI